ncbi:MAG TPA: ABA4-like family protein [Planctomycetaceae bacterium]|nr:ABA4-like family protein [Planctomycetaceae bacterium]
MADQLFSLAGIATLGWVLLILLPRWWITRRMAELEVFPIYLAILYLVGVVPLVVAAGPGIIRDFGNAEGVANLLARRDVALIAWIHILVFDQVVGVLIYRDNMSHRYVPIFGQSLVLILTFLFGPVGYLAYSAARAVARRRRSQAARQMWRKEEATDVAKPQPTPRTKITATSALQMLTTAWSRERGLFAVGVLGLALGATGLATAVFRGRMIPPEGDLSKAASFDGAIGIFLLTLAVFVGLAPFTERGRRVWTGTVVALALMSYAMENIQISRGIDPRFSHVGSIADQLGGAFFLLIATGLLVTFVILFAKILLNSASRNGAPLMLAIRYGCGATAFGFATGYLMSAVVGSRYGVAGNILPLHALGFHSLQALPLVALFFIWSDVEPAISRHWIHLAGLAWIGACVAVAWQLFAGRAPLEPSLAIFAAVGLLLVWMVTLARGALAWRSAIRAQTAAVVPPQPVLAQSR